MNYIDETIKIIEENFFSFCRFLGSLNSSAKQKASIGAMSTGVPVSDINWAFNEKPLNSGDAEYIKEIINDYKKNNLRFEWWIYPCGNSLDTFRVLRDAGFCLYTKIPCMVADLNEFILDKGTTDNIAILPVKSKNDLLIWESISFDGFEMPARAKEPYVKFVSSFEITAPSPQKLFIAYVDGQPVASSLLFIHQKTAGIYYISTLPAFRNKGCGLKITQASMKAAKDLGFREVILQATPLGAKVYHRAGFKEYCYAEIYKFRG